MASIIQRRPITDITVPQILEGVNSNLSMEECLDHVYKYLYNNLQPKEGSSFEKCVSAEKKPHLTDYINQRIRNRAAFYLWDHAKLPYDKDNKRIINDKNLTLLDNALSLQDKATIALEICNLFFEKHHIGRPGSQEVGHTVAKRILGAVTEIFHVIGANVYGAGKATPQCFKGLKYQDQNKPNIQDEAEPCPTYNADENVFISSSRPHEEHLQYYFRKSFVSAGTRPVGKSFDMCVLEGCRKALAIFQERDRGQQVGQKEEEEKEAKSPELPNDANQNKEAGDPFMEIGMRDSKWKKYVGGRSSTPPQTLSL